MECGDCKDDLKRIHSNNNFETRRIQIDLEIWTSEDGPDLLGIEPVIRQQVYFYGGRDFNYVIAASHLRTR